MALVRLVGPEGRERRQPPAAARRRARDQGGGHRRPRRRRRSSRARSPPWSPSSRPRAASISVRAYDKAHKLNRARKTRTFQQMSASDMVQQGRRRGGPLPAGRAHDGRPRVLPAEQRDRLGLPLAARADARLRGRRHRRKLELPQGQQDRRRADRADVAGQHDLVPPAHERRAAADDGQHPRLGPQEQAGRHRAPRQQRADHVAGRASSAPRSPATSAAGHRGRGPRRGQQRRGQRAREEPRSAGWPTRSTRPTGPLREPRDQGRRQGQDRGRRHAIQRRRSRSRPRPTATRHDRLSETFQIAGRSPARCSS